MREELRSYFGELRRELDKLPARPPRGELLRRAFEIPLVWPDWECPPGRPVVQQMSQALAPWGGKVYGAKSREAVAAKVAEIAAESGAKRFARWRTPYLDSFGFESALASIEGIEWIAIEPREIAAAKSPAARRALLDRVERAEFAIVDCDFAVAHTGSLVVRHDGVRDGWTNLLPWTLVAVVDESRVVRDVQEAAERVSADVARDGVPSALLFTTGPSRSGDIDLRVGQGAAGPGRHHVVVLEGA